MKLFTKGTSNPKSEKSDKSGKGYFTLLLHLAPAKLSGFEVCSSRSCGCTEACLNEAGRGRMNSVQQARIRRTKMFFLERDKFKEQIVSELIAFTKRCRKHNVKPAVRMNATSDVLWERVWPELFDAFPDVQFYDYTKHFKRCLPSYNLPPNYHLTFSRCEDNDSATMAVLHGGSINVAAVFADKNHPPKWCGFPVYNADEDDLRFLDPSGGHVGALYAKGKAKHDTTGFVIRE